MELAAGAVVALLVALALSRLPAREREAAAWLGVLLAAVWLGGQVALRA